MGLEIPLLLQTWFIWATDRNGRGSISLPPDAQASGAVTKPACGSLLAEGHPAQHTLQGYPIGLGPSGEEGRRGEGRAGLCLSVELEAVSVIVGATQQNF